MTEQDKKEVPGNTAKAVLPDTSFLALGACRNMWFRGKMLLTENRKYSMMTIGIYTSRAI